MTHRYNLTPTRKELVGHRTLSNGQVVSEYVRRKTVFTDSTGKEYVWFAGTYTPVVQEAVGAPALVERTVTTVLDETVQPEV